MKKILFYFNGIYNGGTEIEAFNLMYQIQKKYEIYFACNNIDNVDKFMFEKIEEIGKFVSVYEKAKFDTIIFCTHAIEQISLIKENFEYDKSYFWYHYYSERQNKFLKIALNEIKCDAIIAVSESSKKTLAQQVGIKKNENKIIVINNIIDVNKIKEIANEPIEYDLSSKLNLVTVARIAPEKRFDRINKIAEELENQNITYTWLIIGKVNPISCSEYEINIKNNLNKHSNIIFIGERDNPFKYMKKADFSVLTSDRETWGLVITESKVVGTPCVVTNFDTAKEQIKDGENGIIIDMKNENYPEVVKKMILMKETLKNNLKKFDYDIDSIIQKWDNIL